MIASLDSFLRTATHRVFAPLLGALYVTGAAVALWGAVSGWRELEPPARLVAEAVTGHFAAATAIALQTGFGLGVIAILGWGRALLGPADRALFAWLIGFAGTTVCWLALALAGMLGPASVLIVAVALAVTTVLMLGPHLASLRRRATPAPAATASEAALAVLLIVVAAIWLWPLVVQTGLPNSDWDSALYHLPLADRYLDGRLINHDPLYSAYSFPGAVSLLYAALIALGLESAVIPLNFQAGLATVVATYVLGRSLAGRRAGLWAAAVLATTHITWQLAVDPRIDGFLALFLLLATIGVVRWLRTWRALPHLALTALALGAAMGTKYTGLVFAAVVSGIVIGHALWRRYRRRPVPDLATWSLCAALLLVPNGFWYLSNALVHGDPVFPMLRGDYFHAPGPSPGVVDPATRLPMATALDPYLAALPEDSPIRQRAAGFEARYQRPRTRTLLDPIDILRRPDEYAVKPNHLASPLLGLFVLLPIALWRRDGSTRRAGFTLYGMAALLYVGLGAQTNLLRYVLPVLPLFAAGAGVLLAWPLPRPWARAWTAAWGLATAAALVVQYGAEQQKLALLQVDGYLESGGDRIAWLSNVGYNFTPAMPRAIARIEREVDAGRMREGDLVFMVGEGKGRLLEMGYLPDSSWFMQRWVVELVNADLSHERIAQSLAAQGVTHILYNRGYYRWVVDYTDTPRSNLAFAMTHLESFLASRTRTVFETPGMILRRLSP